MIDADLRIVPISDAVRLHLSDIGHNPALTNTTFENAQARERTQVLMDIGNDVGGFVIGTGDLSEAALGWSTYNGDHMSGYAVNAGVPKTLVRYLVEWSADEEFEGAVSTILHDICATPISPGLLPTVDGKSTQDTEKLVGPYRLHDFFLYNAIRFSFPPRRVFFLALAAFGDEYEPREIVRWLDVFYRRFFANQFKRSAVPDGPKVGSVALSPRGDWRMPSDATATLWLDEVAQVVAGIDTV
jgi:NAD+ synthase (glutamine-hydrolysing)